jgi:hypothetical protein
MPILLMQTVLPAGGEVMVLDVAKSLRADAVARLCLPLINCLPYVSLYIYSQHIPPPPSPPTPPHPTPTTTTTINALGSTRYCGRKVHDDDALPKLLWTRAFRVRNS